MLLFFLGTACARATPFARRDWPPMAARGMNPQLQNPGMATPPPNLYLGYVATAVPFAFAIAALISRRLDAEWLGVVRGWALVSWVFLTVGIVLCMWWGYGGVRWGGYLAWGPGGKATFLTRVTGHPFFAS